MVRGLNATRIFARVGEHPCLRTYAMIRIECKTTYSRLFFFFITSTYRFHRMIIIIILFLGTHLTY